MKILITGSHGQLGRCLQDRVSQYDVDVVAADADVLDITDESAVAAFIHQQQPNLIINAAAYTAVDKAETERELAIQVNEVGPANLAKGCAELDIPIIHVSTDYVFDGLGMTPYRPNGCTAPQSVYGETKLAGETAVTFATAKHVIIRTAWVFSEYGNNFVKTMLRLAGERDTLTVVADQYGCPTYAGDLADAILKIVAEIQKDSGWSKYGTYHFCGEEATSWHGFARAIVALSCQKKMLEQKSAVLPIATKDYPTPATRPEYSVLDCSGFPVEGVERNWQRSLEIVLKKLKTESSISL
ncbi:dTDP-4-dehydrorhamnose reductase [Endozoicomonas ascidiicola]|uniref:dTDP-4-dehydrorhamnose reductase n=1 Tax=Endozoicomonas ascidiicola TaxID=1698521 RepID=UPI0008353330|nr:dTDP-4-dehydrorhamnose reductase [Endozoicomonas ascidiicola]